MYLFFHRCSSLLGKIEETVKQLVRQKAVLRMYISVIKDTISFESHQNSNRIMQGESTEKSAVKTTTQEKSNIN